MALTKTQAIKHTFGGGWAVAFGPSVDGQPNSGTVVIPFLTDAEDCLFELDGGPHCIGGASKVNTSAVASGAVINGVFDYWRQGTGAAPARRRVLHAGTVCLADADNGTFATTLSSGLESGKVPCYCTFDDLLIYSSDSATDVPRSWDQTTAQNLAGTPPRFSFCVTHKNRAWAAGDYTNPSRLYYSANVDPEDWVGATSGSIDIDPNDGDMITGLVSHKDVLFVHKGPNKGAIHIITGSSPTGSDAFARKNYAIGIGACWHNAIFPYGNDIGFVSQFGTIHSLDATQNFGDFIGASLSRQINPWIFDHLNYARLRYISAAQDVLREIVYITMSVDASTSNNVTLAMDFRNKDNIRWSKLVSYQFGCVAPFVDTLGLRRVLAGGNDGYVRRINITERAIDGTTALAYKWTTPFITYGNGMEKKTLGGASLSLYPKNNVAVTLGWKCDGNDRQTDTVTQGGGVTANSYLDRFIERVTGQFSAVQYDCRQSILGADIECHGFTVKVHPDGDSMENFTLAFSVDGADFDGTNDYLSRGALSGVSNSKSGIFSCWLRIDGGNGSDLGILQGSGGSPSFVIWREASGSGRFRFLITDSSGTTKLDMFTSGVYAAGATWRHVLASWDVSTAGARSIYVNDVSDLTVLTFANATLAYTESLIELGAKDGTGASRFNGCMAEFYFAPGQYLDFSDANNRRLFISATGKPVDLGADGSTPTGTAPAIYEHLNDGENPANFALNYGTGGNFGTTGSLDTASTSPSD